MNHSDQLSPGQLAFTALAGEYCRAMGGAAESTPRAFVREMTRLLPRIYMAATDLPAADDADGADAAYIPGALTPEYYDSIRLGVETLLGPDDTYLEVFVEDMKYSDTPISASVSEELTDIFQVLFNFLATMQDATTEHARLSLQSVKDDFEYYWSSKLCNVMRPLNALRYNPDFAPDFDDEDDGF